MNRIIRIIAVVVILAGGYLGAKYFGLIGGPAAMNADEVSAYLENMAKEINEADGGLNYDDFSKLVSATHMGKQITIRGDSILKTAQLDDGYIATREALATDKLCSDEAARAALAGGARFVYFWFSADNERIGGVDISGADYCASKGR